MTDRADLGGAALLGFVERWSGSPLPTDSLARAVASSILHWAVTPAEPEPVYDGTKPFVDAYIEDPDAAPPWGWAAGPAPGTELEHRDIDRSHNALFAWEHLGLLRDQNPEDAIAMAGAVVYAAQNASDVESARAIGRHGAELQIAAIRELHAHWGTPDDSRPSDDSATPSRPAAEPG